MIAAPTIDAPSPLLVQAVEDMLAGAAFTAPIAGNFAGPRDHLAAPEDVTETCAVGALQVGRALRLGLPRWYSPGYTAEFDALTDAYYLRYASSVILDNDRWGRGVVVARCKELLTTASPADLADTAGPA